MNRLETKLRASRTRGKRGIAPFVTAGDGGLETTLAVMRALDEAGATCIELGLPFSDPVADGPVLQAAADRAIAAGTTFEGVLRTLSRFRAESALPVVLMGYANTFLARGFDASIRAIAQAGGDGVIVADLPVEEGRDVAALAVEKGLCPIFFVAPTTSAERMARAAGASRGFVYAIGRLGVTGRATELDAESLEFLSRVRRQAKELPVAVGFGISTPDAVSAALREADLAIVGSALVERLHAAGSHAPAAARLFLGQLMKGIPPCIPP